MLLYKKICFWLRNILFNAGLRMGPNFQFVNEKSVKTAGIFFSFIWLSTTCSFVLWAFFWPTQSLEVIKIIIGYFSAGKTVFEYLYSGLLSYLFFQGVVNLILFFLYVNFFLFCKVLKKNIQFLNYFSFKLNFVTFYVTFIGWCSFTDTVLLESILIVFSLIYLFFDTCFQKTESCEIFVRSYTMARTSKTYGALSETKKTGVDTFSIKFFFWTTLVCNEKSKWLWGSLILAFIIPAVESSFKVLTPSMYLSFWLCTPVFVYGIVIYIRLLTKIGYASKEFVLFFPWKMRKDLIGEKYEFLTNFLVFFLLCWILGFVVIFQFKLAALHHFDINELWLNLDELEKTLLYKKHFLKNY